MSPELRARFDEEIRDGRKVERFKLCATTCRIRPPGSMGAWTCWKSLDVLEERWIEPRRP